MHILHIASEFAPVAKAGGLGDVLLGLSRELHQLGHRVDVLVPKYDCLRMRFLSEMVKTPFTFETDYKGRKIVNSVWEGKYAGLTVTFIEPKEGFFERGDIYGQVDDIDRFSYFSKACADYVSAKGLRPDVIQTHDWQTAMIPLMLKEKIPVLFTIHNLHYQGRCDRYHLDYLGLKCEDIGDPVDARLINFMKAGIVHSQAVVTVSPTYREEILTKEFGEGLDETLRQHQKKLFGVLNGIDVTYWDPGNDPVLPLKYGADNLDGKRRIKEDVKKTLGLSEGEKPLVCSITRLVPQKGIPLIIRSIERTLEKGGQFILVGSSPIPEVAEEFQKLKDFYKGNQDVVMVLSFEHDLVHWIYGGSDMIVVPSEFEPCGLTQLIALRYGTLPIVRRTGGLADTIFDLDKYPETGNGFAFDQSNAPSLDFALDRALQLWHNSRDGWNTVVRRAMSQDHSWSNQAGKYLDLYQKLATKKIYEFA